MANYQLPITPLILSESHYKIFGLYIKLEFEPTLTPHSLYREDVNVEALSDLVKRGDLDMMMSEQDRHLSIHYYLTEKGELTKNLLINEGKI